MSTERIIVQKGASEALIAAITTLVKQIRPSNTENPHIPPIAAEHFVPKILGLIQDAKDRGAELLVGDLNSDGVHLSPHVVLGVEPGWPIWDLETFGPMRLIIRSLGRFGRRM